FEIVKTGEFCNVREVAMAVAREKSGSWTDQENIEIPVVVEVEEGAPVADGLKDVERPRSGDFPLVMDSGGFRDFGERRSAFGLRAVRPVLCGGSGRAAPAPWPASPTGTEKNETDSKELGLPHTRLLRRRAPFSSRALTILSL